MRIIRPFFFGIIAALGALLFQMTASLFFFKSQVPGSLFFSQMSPALIASSFIEEALIFILVYKNFQEIKSASIKEKVYGSILVGLGFSFVELFFALFNLSEEPGALSFALPFLGIIFIHALTASIVGYSLAKARMINLALIARTIFVVFLIHLIYNSLVIYSVL